MTASFCIMLSSNIQMGLVTIYRPGKGNILTLLKGIPQFAIEPGSVALAKLLPVCQWRVCLLALQVFQLLGGGGRTSVPSSSQHPPRQDCPDLPRALLCGTIKLQASSFSMQTWSEGRKVILPCFCWLWSFWFMSYHEAIQAASLRFLTPIYHRHCGSNKWFFYTRWLLLYFPGGSPIIFIHSLPHTGPSFLGDLHALPKERKDWEVFLRKR